MTKHDVTQAVSGIKQLLGEDEAFLREGLRGYLQEVLESEMTAQLGASKGERVATRVGYRSGYYGFSISVSSEGARFTAITNPGRPREPKQTGCASGPAFTCEDVPARSPETFQSISRDVRSAGLLPETAGRGGTASPADAGTSGPAHTIMTGASC